MIICRRQRHMIERCQMHAFRCYIFAARIACDSEPTCYLRFNIWMQIADRCWFLMAWNIGNWTTFSAIFDHFYCDCVNSSYISTSGPIFNEKCAIFHWLFDLCLRAGLSFLWAVCSAHAQEASPHWRPPVKRRRPMTLQRSLTLSLWIVITCARCVTRQSTLAEVLQHLFTLNTVIAYFRLSVVWYSSKFEAISMI